MRSRDLVDLICVESDRSRTSATVYDLSERQDTNSRLRRINILKHENALLSRMIAETRVELARLQKLLERSSTRTDSLR